MPEETVEVEIRIRKRSRVERLRRIHQSLLEQVVAVALLIQEEEEAAQVVASLLATEEFCPGPDRPGQG